MTSSGGSSAKAARRRSSWAVCVGGRNNRHLHDVDESQRAGEEDGVAALQRGRKAGVGGLENPLHLHHRVGELDLRSEETTGTTHFSRTERWLLLWST